MVVVVPSLYFTWKGLVPPVIVTTRLVLLPEQIEAVPLKTAAVDAEAIVTETLDELTVLQEPLDTTTR